MTGLGYRQKQVLARLNAAPADVPTGYLVRACGADPRTVHMSLVGLERRGLVRHVAHGRWEATTA